MEELKIGQIVRSNGGQLFYKILDIRNGEALVQNLNITGYLALCKLEAVPQEEINEYMKEIEERKH